MDWRIGHWIDDVPTEDTLPRADGNYFPRTWKQKKRKTTTSSYLGCSSKVVSTATASSGWRGVPVGED
jgi:hypothetical protein